MGLRDIGSWLVANDTVAFVTWIGSLVAVVGLPATFKQVWSARKVANAAEDAVKALEDRLSPANLSFAYSQIESIRTMVVSGNSAAAQVLFGPVKRTIIESCHTNGPLKSLHRGLAERAPQEGVSLNALAVAMLTQGLGQRMPRDG